MIQQFREINFRSESRERIRQMQDIVEDYSKQGLRLTARQLYYQFVARDLIPNTQRSYKNLTGLLADARYAGLVAWDAIEDRGREPVIWSQYASIKDMINRQIRNFRLPRWKGQENYVELWVEKQALAGVLEPIAAEYHATLMVNKGYSSASAMYESALRFATRENSGQQPILFYLGDHDPSGEDMVRDIRDRLIEFGVESIKVLKLALTMAQIEEYEPPPNPAKTTDSRAAAYIEKHGESSWEVDALPPDVLNQIIRDAFEREVNKDALKIVLAAEKQQKDQLTKALKSFNAESFEENGD